MRLFSPAAIWFAFGLVLCTASSSLAGLVLDAGQTLTSFDADIRYRAPEDFDLTGTLKLFTPSATLNDTSILNSSATDILVISYSDTIQESQLQDLGEVLTLLNSQIDQGLKFAVAIIAFNVEEETGSDVYLNYGDPSIIATFAKPINFAPRSTSEALISFTNNFTSSPVTVRAYSEMGARNAHLRGPGAFVVHALYSALLTGLVVYIIYFQVTSYIDTRKFSWPIPMKTWIQICIILYSIIQTCYLWIPLYPSRRGEILGWVANAFAFDAYSLVLLIWFRVVSHDQNTRAVWRKITGFATYAAMASFSVCMFVGALSTPFPNDPQLSLARRIVFIILPIILVTQAILFLYFGLALRSAIKSFNMTDDKKVLINKMVYLMIGAIVTFFIAAVASTSTSFLAFSITALWVSRVVPFVALGTLLVFILLSFRITPNRSTDNASSSRSRSGSFKPNLKGTGQGPEKSFSRVALSVSMISIETESPSALSIKKISLEPAEGTSEDLIAEAKDHSSMEEDNNDADLNV